MKLDVVSHKGGYGKPAVVFIHGLGMNKDIWVNPLSSRILCGQFPLKVLLQNMFPGEDAAPQTMYNALLRKGYSVIAWSQKRPAGPIDSAVTELKEILRMAGDMTRAGVILIGHSRGGLIARRYLLEERKSIKGLITISTPHVGSSIAGLAKYVSPLVALVNPLVPAGEKGTLSFSIKRIFDFLRSPAIKELLPDSAFFHSLKDGPYEGVYYASIGGTNPTLFTFRNLSFPDVLEKIVPENLYPEEMKKGKGDGLVSAESAKMPWAEEHYDFDRNHAEVLFDEDMRETLVKVIETRVAA